MNRSRESERGERVARGNVAPPNTLPPSAGAKSKGSPLTPPRALSENGKTSRWPLRPKRATTVAGRVSVLADADDAMRTDNSPCCWHPPAVLSPPADSQLTAVAAPSLLSLPLSFPISLARTSTRGNRLLGNGGKVRRTLGEPWTRPGWPKGCARRKVHRSQVLAHAMRRDRRTEIARAVRCKILIPRGLGPSDDARSRVVFSTIVERWTDARANPLCAR